MFAAMDAELNVYQELAAPAAGTAAQGSSVVTPVKKLHVKACGRTFGVDSHASTSLLELQSEVQRALQMEGQDFQFFDGMGKPLSTDRGLREAVDAGLTPIGASLSDASIHFIENRREELAQMQWKLVREKMHGCMAEVKQTTRQVDDFQAKMHAVAAEHAVGMEQLKAEVLQAVEHERDAHEASIRQLSERVNALALLVNGEQNKREFAMQNVEHQVQELRNLIDTERDTRQRENSIHLSTMKDGKVALEGQRRIQEAFESKHVTDVETLRNEIMVAGKTWNDLLKDQIEVFRTGLDDVGYKVRLHETHVQAKLTEVEASAYTAIKRTAELEAWCATTEERMSEVASLQAARFDKVAERQEQAHHLIESVRHEEKLQLRRVESTADKLKDLEEQLTKNEEELRAQLKKESEKCLDDLQRVQTLIRSEQTKRLAEFEQKVTERLSMESCMRERGTKSLYEELNKRLEKDPQTSACMLDSVGSRTQRAPQERHKALAMPQSARQSFSSASSLCSAVSPPSVRAASPVKFGSSASVPSFPMAAAAEPLTNGHASFAQSSQSGSLCASAGGSTPQMAGLPRAPAVTTTTLGAFRQIGVKPAGTHAPPPRQWSAIPPNQWPQGPCSCTPSTSPVPSRSHSVSSERAA
eukprot:gb/GFBE01007533.1/.p1 GENE.gb/GFBE01007533.1/~~gb/GFBE01007533.1/.p1  ORF type:complete len:643 (+),score=148.25 gb/GFBE01007533.1/:1-1929(+)